MAAATLYSQTDLVERLSVAATEDDHCGVRIAAEDAQALPGRGVQAHLHLLDLVGVPPPGGLRGSSDGGRPALDAENEHSFDRSGITMDCENRDPTLLFLVAEAREIGWFLFALLHLFLMRLECQRIEGGPPWKRRDVDRSHLATVVRLVISDPYFRTLKHCRLSESSFQFANTGSRYPWGAAMGKSMEDLHLKSSPALAEK